MVEAELTQGTFTSARGRIFLFLWLPLEAKMT